MASLTRVLPTRRVALFGVGLALAAALFGVVASAARFETADAATNCSTGSAALAGDETQALQLVNAFRAQNGLGPLLVSPTLNTMAAWMSEDMSRTGVLSHVDSLGRSPYQRAVQCGYPGGAAENAAMGYPSASAVVQGWIGSDGHRRNLLGPYAVMGIGRTGNWWTLNLGFTADQGSFPVGSAQPPPGGANPTSTPTPRATQPPNSGGGNPPPPPTSEADAPAIADQPAGIRTVLPAKDHPQWSLPANVPVRRAMVQMVASE